MQRFLQSSQDLQDMTRFLPTVELCHESLHRSSWPDPELNSLPWPISHSSACSSFITKLSTGKGHFKETIQSIVKHVKRFRAFKEE